MPTPLSVKIREAGCRRYIDVLDHALWLVSYFEGYVLERANRDYMAKGRKPREFVADFYKKKWLDNAFDLVSARPLEEVVHVIDWLFNVHFGFLPIGVVECSQFPMDRKVTRIRQVEENYDLLVEEMHSGVDPVRDVMPRKPGTSAGSSAFPPATGALQPEPHRAGRRF